MRNIAPFSRFLEAASFSQGAPVNASEVAREAHIERTMVENYFSLLEDLLIAVRLPVFAKFKQDYPAAGCYLFYGGAETLHMENVVALPLAKALQTLDLILAEPGAALTSTAGPK